MASQTSGGLLKFSVALDEARISEVETVARELVPTTSRNRAIDYLLGLGIAAHRARTEEDARAREMLALAREVAV